MKPRKHINPPDIAAALEELFGGEWVASSGLNAGYWVQLADIDGRRRVTAVLMLGEPVTGADLRKIPIGSIENAASLGVQPAGDDADEVRRELAKLPPLRRVGQNPLEWSWLVARHYMAWARLVPRPAAAMAAAWGVNRQTVNTWIREARMRGLLPDRWLAPGAEVDRVMAMPPGPDRDAALEAVRRRQTGEPDPD